MEGSKAEPPSLWHQLQQRFLPRSIGDALSSSSSGNNDTAAEALSKRLQEQRCPRELEGTWVQDASACESLCPLLKGLNMPLPSVLCPLADRVHTTLTIRCTTPAATLAVDGSPPDSATLTQDVGSREVQSTLQVEDRTYFGKNITEVQLGGEERLTQTRGKRKSFYLSGKMQDIENGAKACVISCRLHERGEGWYTLQQRYLEDETSPRSRLVERNVLIRGEKKDKKGNVIGKHEEKPIVVYRYFNRKSL